MGRRALRRHADDARPVREPGRARDRHRRRRPHGRALLTREAIDDVVQRTRLAAYAWCEEGETLLLVRIASGYPDAGTWTLPGGGLDFGEDPAAGVLRELREETGLEGRVDELTGILSYVLRPSETTRGDRVHVVAILYRVTPTGGDLRDERDESTDRAAWIPFERLDTLPLVDLVTWANGVARP